MRSAADKIISLDEACALREALRAEGRAVAWTNGCYDLLHAGHVASIEFARTQADALFIGLSSDASVRANKGSQRPVVGERDRAVLLAALAAVDAVILYDEQDVTPLIEAIKPDVLVKGADTPKVLGQAFVEGYGGRIALAPVVEGVSTTDLIAKIKALD